MCDEGCGSWRMKGQVLEIGEIGGPAQSGGKRRLEYCQ